MDIEIPQLEITITTGYCQLDNLFSGLISDLNWSIHSLGFCSEGKKRLKIKDTSTRGHRRYHSWKLLTGWTTVFFSNFFFQCRVRSSSRLDSSRLRSWIKNCAEVRDSSGFSFLIFLFVLRISENLFYRLRFCSVVTRGVPTIVHSAVHSQTHGSDVIVLQFGYFALSIVVDGITRLTRSRGFDDCCSSECAG